MVGVYIFVLQNLVTEFSRPKCMGCIRRLDVRKSRSAQQRQASRWLKMLAIDLLSKMMMMMRMMMMMMMMTMMLMTVIMIGIMRLEKQEN